MESFEPTHKNLFLSIGSAIASVASFIFHHVTKSDISWVLGCIATLIAIWAGVLTIKEKRMNMNLMRGEAEKIRVKKSGGRL